MHGDSWQLILDIVLLLSGALFFGGIFSRLGLSPLVGYLLAGMFLGSAGGIHAIESEHNIEAIAELGVTLLLFSLGLEFSWQRLKAFGNKALWGAILQVLLTFVLSAIIARVFSIEIKQSLLIACMITLSSTACVLRVLSDKGELDSIHGRYSLAVLLMQDIAVIPMLMLVTLLSSESHSLSGILLDVGSVVGLGLALVAFLYVVLFLVSNYILGALTLEKNRELTVLLAVITGLGSSWLSHYVGLSPSLGAFLAGMFLGSSHFATQIRADISSLRIVLLTLFFASAGMTANPAWMLAHWDSIALLSIAVLLGKTLVLWAIFRFLGLTHGYAITVGICLAQLGEFAFVIGGISRSSNLMDEELFMLMNSTVIVTLFIVPFIIPKARRYGLLVERLVSRKRSIDIDQEARAAVDVLIVGFGPAGEAVGEVVSGQGLNVLVLDLNQSAKQRAEKCGFHGQVGDAADIDIIEHAKIEDAKLVVITLPVTRASLASLKVIRRVAPKAHIVMRSRHQRKTAQMADSGADYVFGDEEEVGVSLAKYSSRYLGLESIRDLAASSEIDSLTKF